MFVVENGGRSRRSLVGEWECTEWAVAWRVVGSVVGDNSSLVEGFG